MRRCVAGLIVDLLFVAANVFGAADDERRMLVYRAGLMLSKGPAPVEAAPPACSMRKAGGAHS